MVKIQMVLIPAADLSDIQMVKAIITHPKFEISRAQALKGSLFVAP